ncbi:MAG: FAD:protein FMN transferase [Gammaproteobacteria bacterium]|nr:FAD:protein FMN transferase [Gammaproteobacteria bacterium]
MRELIACLLLASLAGCDRNPLLPRYDLSGSAMGTTFSITVTAPPAHVDLDALQIDIIRELERIEQIASTYREDSELSRLNAGVTGAVTSELCGMIASAQAVSAETDGAFDISVGELVNAWGFGAEHSAGVLPAEERIAAAMQSVGYQGINANCDTLVIARRDNNTQIDLSGWAKGYAVDRVAELLQGHGIDNSLVEIGGEIRVQGHNARGEKYAIAIERPLDDDEIDYSVVRITDTAVASSGDYRNYFEVDGIRYSHTIDPRTGWPVEHNLTGVTVIDSNTARADALATALLVLGPEEGPELAERLDLAALFLIRTEVGISTHSSSAFEEVRTE